MQQDYESKIATFNGTRTYTALQHTREMTNYFEIYEIDVVDVQMRIFLQIIAGEVRTWFRSLTPQSIDILRGLCQQF